MDHFSYLFVAKIVLLFEKTKIKRGRGRPIVKTLFTFTDVSDNYFFCIQIYEISHHKLDAVDHRFRLHGDERVRGGVEPTKLFKDHLAMVKVEKEEDR